MKILIIGLVLLLCSCSKDNYSPTSVRCLESVKKAFPEAAICRKAGVINEFIVLTPNQVLQVNTNWLLNTSINSIEVLPMIYLGK